jgi:spore coat protein U-like protein
MRRCIEGFIAGVLLTIAGSQRAAAAATCSLSVSGVNFGVYSTISPAPSVSTTQVTIQCTQQGQGATRVGWEISFSTGSSGSYTSRTLRSGANVLQYNLFNSAAYAQVYGNGGGATVTFSGSFTTNPPNPTRSQTTVVYGRIPAQQDVLPGSYTDSITVTATY